MKKDKRAQRAAAMQFWFEKKKKNQNQKKIKLN